MNAEHNFSLLIIMAAIKQADIKKIADDMVKTAEMARHRGSSNEDDSFKLEQFSNRTIGLQETITLTVKERLSTWNKSVQMQQKIQTRLLNCSKQCSKNMKEAKTKSVRHRRECILRAWTARIALKCTFIFVLSTYFTVGQQTRALKNKPKRTLDTPSFWLSLWT